MDDPEIDALPPELEKSVERFERLQAHIAKSEGYGATKGAQFITSKWILELSDGLQGILKKKPQTSRSEFIKIVRRLEPPETLALCIMQGALHSIGKHQKTETFIEAAIGIGDHINSECWRQELTEQNPELTERLEKYARGRYRSTKDRHKVARAIALKLNFNTNDWTREQRFAAGSWAISVLCKILPNVFTVVREGKNNYLTLTAAAIADADCAIADVILSNPVWLPITREPPPWTGWNEGGTWDKRLASSLCVVRHAHKDTADFVREAIACDTLKPTLDALNALQSVPWKINEPILDVIRECEAGGIGKVPRLPTHEWPVSEPPKPWEEMDQNERRLWKSEVENIGRMNRGVKSDYILYEADMRTAELLAQQERFWTHMNLDWRGRVYGVPSFNFQRQDRVRALFLFADGEPIGEEGLYWLKVHAANCGDDNKLSKRPFNERIEWIDRNWTQIEATVVAPMQTASWWQQADTPFQFLAACFELVAAVDYGPSYVSHLPVTFDGSCNGLQHLCAMTRAPEGSLVNLTPQAEPQDVYQVVADRVKERVERDLKIEDKRQIAQICLDFGIDRKLVKRNVMTYGYGANTGSMAQQQWADLMVPLRLDVLKGELERHPFGSDGGTKAGGYLASHIYKAVEEVVDLPAQMMRFLRKLAEVMADENKPLHWETPAGLPWINRYHQSETKQVRLWLHDRGVEVPKTKLAVGYKQAIDRDGAIKGAAPNFVHACDAAHLMLTVNAAVKEDITSIATVHDSFGCLASQAGRFREIIREQFAKMYQEHDVLQEVLEQAKEGSGDHKGLPSRPAEGRLDIQEVLKAEYAFA